MTNNCSSGLKTPAPFDGESSNNRSLPEPPDAAHLSREYLTLRRAFEDFCERGEHDKAVATYRDAIDIKWRAQAAAGEPIGPDSIPEGIHER